MEELEQLRIALAHFREEITRTGQHGVIPEVHAAGPLREIGASLQIKRSHLLAFFADLRERVHQVSGELAELGLILEPDAAATRPRIAADPPPAAESDRLEESVTSVSASVERLRKLGTVLALETARAVGLSGLRAGELLERFDLGLNDLEEVVCALAVTARNGGVKPAMSAPDTSSIDPREACRTSWQRLRETVDSIERRLVEVEER